MTDSLFPWPFAGRTEDAIRLEAFETPEWCAEAILDRELLTRWVLDPCCGHGTLSRAAIARGYVVMPSDLGDWGYGKSHIDFLAVSVRSRLGGVCPPDEASVFINPPFSLAVKFVEHAWSAGIRKIVCFQRFAWWESLQRTSFWRNVPPTRVYICRERATCWRFDIPPEQRTGTGTPTAYAWFVWERGHPSGTILGHLDRGAP